MRPPPLPLVSATLYCPLCARKFRILDWNETSLAKLVNGEYLKHHRHWHPQQERVPLHVVLRCELCMEPFATLTTSTTTLMSVGSWARREHNVKAHGLTVPLRAKRPPTLGAPRKRAPQPSLIA